MKASTILAVSALTLSGFVTAQAGLSQCVITCSVNAGALAGCTYTDPSCACTNTVFQNSAGACLIANCTAAEQQAGLALQQALCAGQTATGVTATVPSGTASASVNPSLLSSVAASASSVRASSMASGTASSMAMSASSAAASGMSSGVRASAASAASGAQSAVAGAASSVAASARPSGAAGKSMGINGAGALVGAAAGVIAGTLLLL